MMSGTRDLNSIIDEARDLLELLRLSGVNYLPKPEKTGPACSEQWSISEGSLNVAQCPAHGAFTGLAAGVWNMDGRLMVAAASGFTEGCAPFSGAEGDQLKKIIDWMAKETGAPPFDSITPVIFYAAACPGVFDLKESVSRVTPLIKKEVERAAPRFIAAFGESAEALAGQTPARGRFFTYSCSLVMPTRGISELVKNPALKKETMEDMKLILKELSDG